MKNKSYLILKDQRIVRSIILLALPIMFSNIFKSLHDIVDMYFISNIDDTIEIVEAQVSAITITGPIMQICQALALGLMVAGTAIMSQYLGANQVAEAKKASGQLLLLSIIVGVVFNILLFIFTPLIIKYMGIDTNSDLYKYSVEYVQFRSFEQTGLFIIYAFQASRQSTGDTVTPVVLNVVSVVLNIILTWFLVDIIGMDIKGAALATVVANMIVIPVCFILMMQKKNNILPLKWKDLKFDYRLSKMLFVIGMPAAISQAFTSFGFLLINSLVADFDGYIINAIGVGNRINSLLLFPAMSVGTVLATFIGQNIGAGQINRAKRSLWMSMLISFVITIGGAVFLMFLRGPLVSIFIDKTDNPRAFNMCVYFLYFLILGLPLMGIFQIWTGCFQGAGRTGLSLLLASARLWVFRLPLIWFLMNIIKIGPASVWYAMVISNFGAAILGTFLYKFIDFKPKVSKMQEKIVKIHEGVN